MKKKSFKILCLSAASFTVGLCSLAALPTLAQEVKEQWILFSNYHEIFTSRMLAEPAHELVQLNVGEGFLSSATSVSAALPGVGSEPGRSYSVEAYQTLGASLYEKERVDLLEKNAQNFIARFKALNPKVLEYTDVSDSKNRSEISNIHIAYTDPTYGPLEVKARIYVSPNTKIVQTALGDKLSVDNFRTRDFFKTFVAAGGQYKTQEPMTVGWKEYVSPLRIFTVHLPDPNKYFVPSEPKFASSDKSEAMYFRFYDPMLQKSLAFNIYGYRFGKDLKKEDVRDIITQRHVKLSYTQITKTSLEKVDDITYKMAYQPTPAPENYNSDFAIMYAKVIGNYLLLYEFFGTPTLVTSPFVTSLVDSVEFHPDMAVKYREEQHPNTEYSDEDPKEGFGQGEGEPNNDDAAAPEKQTGAEKQTGEGSPAPESESPSSAPASN